MKRLWVVMFVWMLMAHPADAAVIISEVLADPPLNSGDANQDGVISSSQDEFVELFNAGRDPVALSGWMLSDALRVRHLFDSDVILPANGVFVIFGGGLPQIDASSTVASSGSLSLNNSGDHVTLLNADAHVVDAWVYGSEGGNDTSLALDAIGGTIMPHNQLTDDAYSPGSVPDAFERREGAVLSGTVVPEPGSLVLFGGFMGLAALRRCLPRAVSRLS